MGMGLDLMEMWLLQCDILEDRAEELIDSKSWQTAGQRIIKISNMEESHLRNTINWLNRNKEYPFSETFISLMQEELENRCQ